MNKILLVIVLMFSVTINCKAQGDFEQSIIEMYESFMKKQIKNSFKNKGIECKGDVRFDKNAYEIVTTFRPSSWDGFKYIEPKKQADLYIYGLLLSMKDEDNEALNDVITLIKIINLKFRFVVSFIDSYGSVIEKEAIMTPEDVIRISQEL